LLSSVLRQEGNVVKRLLPLLALAALTATLAACGGGGGGGGSNTTTTSTSTASSVPNPIVFCSDITYPPEESYPSPGAAPVGSDIDIATDVAKLLGSTATFKNTTFDSIIAALNAKKCDAVISGMNDTPARRKQVDFVDYLKVGQSFMVQKGNPKHITSLASAAGHSVSVEAGTTDRDFLAAQSAILVKKGHPAITIKTFPKDTDAAAALKAGRVDAYFGDSPVVVYYISKDPSFAVGGSPISPIPIGIALRKGDPLEPKVRSAINTLYTNGTIKKIVAKWGMTNAVTLLH
jgi:polar amino acid transport system substrate-binding protein